MNQWLDVGSQNSLWKNGSYDYVLQDLYAVKYSICRYFIEQEIRQPIKMLDVGAGLGHLFSLLKDKIKRYVWVDISEEAKTRFLQLNQKIIDERVLLINQRIEETDLEKDFNVILLLGFISALYKDNIIDDLYTNFLQSGVLILDVSKMHDTMQLQQSRLRYKVEYNLSQFVDGIKIADLPAYQRVLYVLIKR